MAIKTSKTLNPASVIGVKRPPNSGSGTVKSTKVGKGGKGK